MIVIEPISVVVFYLKNLTKVEQKALPIQNRFVKGIVRFQHNVLPFVALVYVLGEGVVDVEVVLGEGRDTFLATMRVISVNMG